MPRKKKEEVPSDPPPPSYISDPSEIIEYYGPMPLSVGKTVEVDGRQGTVVGFKGLNMVVVYDDDLTQSPYICHPTWRVTIKRATRSKT